MNQLKGKVAIVTGGATGIGRAIANAYVAEGAKVAIVDHNEPAASAAARELESSAFAIKADIAERGDVERMIAEVKRREGRIDVLVNNAALWKELERRPYWEIPPEEWDRVFAVNTRGPFLATVAVTPTMVAQGKGKLIYLGSATVWTAQATLTHYVSSKAALIGLMHCVARELGPRGICANMIHPGMTDTGGTSREYLEARAKLRLIPRVQEPTDLAGAAVFLASDASDFITGQQLHVDGGVVLR